MTRVHVFAKDLFRRSPPPRVGQTGTLRLARGIITEPFLDETFCDDANVMQHSCGA